jgi:hypothetical protein
MVNLQKIISVLCALFLFSLPHEATSAPSITHPGTLLGGNDIENYTSHTSGTNYSWKSVRIQATASGTASHFIVYMYNKNTWDGDQSSKDVGAAVYADAGSGVNPGALLSSLYEANYDFDAAGTAAGVSNNFWLAFALDTPIEIESGTYYHLTLLIEDTDDVGTADRIYHGRDNDCACPDKWFTNNPDNDTADHPPDDGTEPDWAAQFDQESPAYTWGLIDANTGHGGTLVITGTDFGTKSPAAPLMWDDAEDETADTLPDGSANSLSQVGYSEWKPKAIESDEAVPATHRITYRDFPYTPYGESGYLTEIAAPHSHSSKGLSGGHYYLDTMDGNNPARDVSITVPTAAGIGNFSTHWYAHWYYRVNSDWPSCGSSPNHKTTVVQSDIQAYGGGTYPNDYSYFNYNNGDTPCHDSEALRYRHSGDIGTCDAYNGDGTWNTFGNAKNAWQQWEEITINDSTNGGRLAKVNNSIIWSCTTGGAWFTNTHGQGIGSFTVGGYFRLAVDPPAGGEQSSDAHRLFDDIYVDDTLSRVMLANNAVYASATIVEPQIPSAWSTNEITVTVNQGALPNGTAYLFVFDSDNDANATGYPVTLSDTTPTPSSSGITFSGVTIGQ